MMKSAIVGALAGLIAFAVALMGWSYLSGRFPQEGRSAQEASAPGSLRDHRNPAPVEEPLRRDFDDLPLPPYMPVGSMEARAKDLPTVAAPAVPAAALPPSDVASVIEAPAPAIKVAAVVEELPPAPAPMPAALSAPAVVAPAVVAVSVAEPTQSEEKVAQSKEVIARFTAAQDALRNFKVQLPPKGGAAAGEILSVPAGTGARQPLTADARDNDPVTAAQPLASPTGVRVTVAAATSSARSSIDPTGDAELVALHRATDAMKRLSRKVGSPRFR